MPGFGFPKAGDCGTLRFSAVRIWSLERGGVMRAKFAGVGHFVPEMVVTNHDLATLMDTTDSWIIERTGIHERRFVREGQGTSEMGEQAARAAMRMAGVTPSDLDFIIFATLSPDYMFPGCGVLLQDRLGCATIGALDVRTQCTGFIYGLAVADAFIRMGMYKRILLVGAETQSMGSTSPPTAGTWQ
jgi:3-oxoacyl-[acyl-carrier-protein] synthase III